MKIYFHLNLEGYSNCYIIANPELKEAIIVDPGKITKEIIQNIENEQFEMYNNHTDYEIVKGCFVLCIIFLLALF